MRTFIAIELPPEALAQLQGLVSLLQQTLSQAEVGGLARWVTGQNIHITLRFLGDTTPTQSRQIARALEASVPQTPSFTLSLSEVGAFPNLRQPNNIWCGVSGEVERLQAFQQSVEAIVQQAGFTPEARPFAAHITLARIRREAPIAQVRTLGQVLQRVSKQAQPWGSTWGLSFPVTHLLFLESELRPGGVHYTVLTRTALKLTR